MILISYFISFLLGWSAIAYLLRNTSFQFKSYICLFAGMMLGIGISSILFIAFTLMHLPFMASFGIELVLAIAASYYCFKKHYFELSFRIAKPEINLLFITMAILFTLALISSLSTFFYETAKFNHGEWDAWSHWNLRAKYIVRAPDTWTYLFQFISHGDYPLFNSGYVARGWAYSGTESIWVPIPLAFISTYSTVFLLISIVWLIQGELFALIAGTFLLATPFFTIVGKYQFADTPLSFFILACLGLLALAQQLPEYKKQLLLTSGLMAGLATWTKNEGLLFALSISGSFLLISLFNFKVRKQELIYLLSTLAIGLTVTLIYKYGFGPANDMTEGLKNTGGIMPKVTDAARYKFITDWFLTEGATFGRWFTNPWPWLIGLSIILGLYLPKKNQLSQIILLTLVGQVCLYFITYLLSFQDLNYHLSTSFYRLCFQLLPAFAAALFILIKPIKAN